MKEEMRDMKRNKEVASSEKTAKCTNERKEEEDVQ